MLEPRRLAVRCCGCPLRMMACVARAEASDTHGSGRPGHMGDVRMVYGTVDLWVCGAVAGHHRGPAPAECSVAAQACDCRMRSSPALMRPTLHPLPQRASPPGVVFAGGGGVLAGQACLQRFFGSAHSPMPMPADILCHMPCPALGLHGLREVRMHACRCTAGCGRGSKACVVWGRGNGG